MRILFLFTLFALLTFLTFEFLFTATSVPVEHVFSGGRDLISHRRCSLKPESITACMCLKEWWKMDNGKSEDTEAE